MVHRDYRFNLDPRKKGLGKILGELENDIMEILWLHGEAAVREVHQLLEQHRKIAYTTVMTVMSRLAEKGILNRRKEGHAFIYSPVSSREEFTNTVVGSVISGLVRDFGTSAISQFLESVDEEELENAEELARLIEEKRRQKGNRR